MLCHSKCKFFVDIRKSHSIVCSAHSSHVHLFPFYLILKHWSANGSPGTGTPPAMYMDIARKIAIEKCNTMEENIVMFTSIALSMSNAAVNTWHAKVRVELFSVEVYLLFHITSHHIIPFILSLYIVALHFMASYYRHS